MFKGEKRSDYFKKVANRIEKFFMRNNDWEATKERSIYKDNGRLLAITDARYLYVTHLLFELSEERLTGCQEQDGKTKVPDEVCFPAPYGSASPTSDYDVGLIGPESGSLTAKFNDYFEKHKEGDQLLFGKPSERVFDTNIYAFTLEYAMPDLYVFQGAGSTAFPKDLFNANLKAYYQMQELASSYFKLYKFWKPYFDELVADAKESLPGSANARTGQMENVDKKGFFQKWLELYEKKYQEWSEENFDSKDKFRAKHNDLYQSIVQQAEKNYKTNELPMINNYVSEMSIALVFAAEAYHTRGTIRVVVGVLQMKKNEIKDLLTVLDYWVSMVENWADANKEFQHCGPSDKVAKCLVKMSKYLYRTFYSINGLDTLLRTSKLSGIINTLKTQTKGLIENFPGKEKPIAKEPQDITEKWVEKYRNKEAQPDHSSEISPFLKLFLCTETENDPLSRRCMDKIQKLIFDISHLLAVASGRGASDFDILAATKTGQLKPRI
ncbi:uncharacterized protein LOC116617858 [Nematostella vectensis]|uniref:uncharacterized protein LOC116617858 n=1 Tax=Nematostella vectensis TaxID=45351 RepID=UPI00139069E9|nr:uncharacterized protein LOC116617858 [Nematostella vectensis]